MVINLSKGKREGLKDLINKGHGENLVRVEYCNILGSIFCSTIVKDFTLNEFSKMVETIEAKYLILSTWIK